MADTSSLRYTTSDEWVGVDGETATIGITDHAQEELGDIALVQLPEVGRMLQQGEKFGEVESIKAVSDLLSPVSGEVTAVNSSLEGAPETVNSEPYDNGWMIKVRMSKPDQVSSLLNETAYKAGID